MSFNVGDTITVTEEHLDKAIEARENRKPGDVINQFCVLAQALKERCLFSRLGHSQFFVGNTAYHLDNSKQMVDNFDNYDYDAIRKTLPLTLTVIKKIEE